MSANPYSNSILSDAKHRRDLAADALRQFKFFQQSIRPEGGFYVLDNLGNPLPTEVQELHTTTRLIHSYVMGKLAGVPGCEDIIDHGMAYLNLCHRDPTYGGYIWSRQGKEIYDDRKLAYGHVFVLLAAASAKLIDHPQAEGILNDVADVLEERFWEEDAGLLADEFRRDWSVFSGYRGFNANMHGAEAFMAAYEATNEERFLERAGRILDFILNRVAPQNDWRLIEHFTTDWTADKTYDGNAMFRPFGTTPGHSFEVARLTLQYWDLTGRKTALLPEIARQIAYRALVDAWDVEQGGFYYTLDFKGAPAVTSKFWWPVTEALGVMATFLKLEERDEDLAWYLRIWDYAQAELIDFETGGWRPEVQADASQKAQFNGKPDIYHSIQAMLFPLTPNLSSLARDLPSLEEIAYASGS